MVKLPIDIARVKGFLDRQEGAALHEAAKDAPRGVHVEIGSYCGKSTVYIGTACQAKGDYLLAIDHHRGSEENQPGEQYFDPDLADGAGGMSSLAAFRATVAAAKLEATIIPIVAPSEQVAAAIPLRLAFLFIDGGHSRAAALADYRNWATRLMAGGVLAIHDVFPDPSDGGRPPYEIYQMALASELFSEIGAVKSLRLLRRL